MGIVEDGGDGSYGVEAVADGDDVTGRGPSCADEIDESLKVREAVHGGAEAGAEHCVLHERLNVVVAFGYGIAV